MRQFVIIALLVCVAFAAPKWHQLENYTFEEYVHDFQKLYQKGSAEFNTRKAIFEKKLAHILHFNKGDSYKKGVNQFTDQSVEELKANTLGVSKSMKEASAKNTQFRQLASKKLTKEQVNALPQNVDWRTQGVVSPVKDQGHCGSCWAFAAIASIESQAAITSGHLKTLSTQQLVSCVQNSYQCGGSGGCEGATAEIAFNYAQIFGLTSEYKYSYNSYFGDSLDCTFNPKQQTVEVTVQGYAQLPQNSYEDLLYVIATEGPLVVSVDASGFHDYESGVFSGCNDLVNIDINHAVTLVGYGTSAEGDYWLVRNSWGTRYGENGYIRVLRTATPDCKKDITPLDGNGCVGFASPIKVCGQCGILSDSAIPIGVNVVG